MTALLAPNFAKCRSDDRQALPWAKASFAGSFECAARMQPRKALEPVAAAACQGCLCLEENPKKKAALECRQGLSERSL